MSLFILTVLTALAADVAPAEAAVSQRHLFPPTQQRLDLAVDTGTVSLRTDSSAKTLEVRVTSDTPCTVSRADTAMTITGCHAEVSLVAPRALIVRVDVGQGDITLDTSNRLRVSVGTGNVTGEARGPARVSVGTGNVQLTGLRREPVVSVATGATELSYATGATEG